jgi:hypothetical protein
MDAAGTLRISHTHPIELEKTTELMLRALRALQPASFSQILPRIAQNDVFFARRRLKQRRPARGAQRRWVCRVPRVVTPASNYNCPKNIQSGARP